MLRPITGRRESPVAKGEGEPSVPQAKGKESQVYHTKAKCTRSLSVAAACSSHPRCPPPGSLSRTRRASIRCLLLCASFLNPSHPTCPPFQFLLFWEPLILKQSLSPSNFFREKKNPQPSPEGPFSLRPFPMDGIGQRCGPPELRTAPPLNSCFFLSLTTLVPGSLTPLLFASCLLVREQILLLLLSLPLRAVSLIKYFLCTRKIYKTLQNKSIISILERITLGV